MTYWSGLSIGRSGGRVGNTEKSSQKAQVKALKEFANIKQIVREHSNRRGCDQRQMVRVFRENPRMVLGDGALCYGLTSRKSIGLIQYMFEGVRTRVRGSIRLTD